jgi:hypothetical protein
VYHGYRTTNTISDKRLNRWRQRASVVIANSAVKVDYWFNITSPVTRQCLGAIDHHQELGSPRVAIGTSDATISLILVHVIVNFVRAITMLFPRSTQISGTIVFSYADSKCLIACVILSRIRILHFLHVRIPMISQEWRLQTTANKMRKGMESGR